MTCSVIRKILRSQFNSIHTDLDECAENATLCDQICTNTFGSYECSCEDGYNLVGEICEGIVASKTKYRLHTKDRRGC